MARSLAGSFDQPLNALRAAETAASTSAASPSATCESVASVAGLMVAKRFFECGSTNVPPMKSWVRSGMVAGTVSGAGLYSQVAGGRVPREASAMVRCYWEARNSPEICGISAKQTQG